MLCLTDLNKIIKFYAYAIQQRIDQLDHLNFFTYEEAENDQSSEFFAIVTKYNSYTTTNENQIKLIRKLRERMIQIFQFFKERSSNQNVLNIIQNRIVIEMNKHIDQIPLPIGLVFQYIFHITKRGCIIKLPSLKKKRLISMYISKQIQAKPSKISQNCYFNIIKRENSVNKSQRVQASLAQKEEIIKNIWNGMDIDKNLLFRIKEGNQTYAVQEMLKRNEKIMTEIKKFQLWKNRKNCITQQFRQSSILAQVKSNSIRRWTSKKRRTLPSSYKHNTIKENLSIFT